MDLHIFWFLLLGILMTGYGILDGFDFGVGILHLFAKTDDERRLMLNSIGPLWDGNEVWLVTFGGALFAAFPAAYSTAFSAFYLPFMFLVLSLVFRAVSIEFRSKNESKFWRVFWDYCFSASSVIATFVFGLIVGNSLQGIPINNDFEFIGTLKDLFNPYSLLVGIFAVSTCAMHGAIYLYLKTEDELQKRIHNWMWTTFGIFIVLYMVTTIFTLVEMPDAIANFRRYPISWLVVLLNILAIANIPRAIFLNKAGYAFVSSCCAIAAFTFLFGIALYPHLIVSSVDKAWSLTIYNSCSSVLTMQIMQIIAFIGLPFVLSYTAIVYWVFRGKVKLGKFSY